MGLGAPPYVGSSCTGNQTSVSCIGKQILYHWAAREALFYYIWCSCKWECCLNFFLIFTLKMQLISVYWFFNPSILVILLISSNSYLVKSLRFSICNMSSANRDSFPSFLIWVTFISLSCPIALLWHSVWC